MALSTHSLSSKEPLSSSSSTASKSWMNSRWLGPCASFICFIHCFSLPFVLLFAPSLIRLVPYQFLHDIELIFWIVALDLGLFSMRKASVDLKWQRLFFGVACLAPFAIFMGKVYATQFILGSMALIQFVLVYWSHRNQKVTPECCHDH